MKIESQPQNYYVLKDILFFKNSERASLSELEDYFTIEALALLIKNNYIVRDTTSIKPGK